MVQRSGAERAVASAGLGLKAFEPYYGRTVAPPSERILDHDEFRQILMDLYARRVYRRARGDTPGL
jgi:hypothetical protein